MGRADYSSYGAGLDLLANGGTPEHPLLTTMGDGIGAVAGSSAAAAQVTGAVSLVWQANPDLSYRQVIDLLEHAATDVGAMGWDAATGFGVINLAAAIDLAKQIKPDTATAIAGTAGAMDNFMPIPWATTDEMTAGERPTDDWSEPLPDPTSNDGAGTGTNGQATPPEGSETASGDGAPTDATPPDGAAAEPDPTDQSTDDPTTTDAAGSDTGAVSEPTDNGTDGDSTESEGEPTGSDDDGNVPTDETDGDSTESSSEPTNDGTSNAATVEAPHDLSMFRFSGGHLSEDGAYVPPDPSDPTNFNTPFIQGKASPGVTIQLLEAGQGIGQATADDEGNWFTCTTMLADGLHTLTAIATDLSGTVSPPSDPLVITIDTQPPTTPTLQLSPSSDSGSSDSDLRMNATTFLLSGTAEPGLVVQILHEGFLLGTATAADDGTWQTTVQIKDESLYQALIEYDYNITAATTDAAGNTSSSAPLLLIIDTQAETPEIKGLAAESDTGSSQSDGITRISNPVITGRAEAGATVQLFSDEAQLVGQATADVNGDWQISPSDFERGTHYLRAVVTDVAGNVSQASSPFKLTITLSDNLAGGGYGGDTTGGGYGGESTGGGYGYGSGYGGGTTGDQTQVLLAPTALQLLAASDTDSSDSDQITGNNTPTIGGLGTAGTIVRLFNNGYIVGQTIVNDDGTWQLNPYYPFSDGVQVLTAITIDDMGHRSPESDPLLFTVDTQPPPAPSALQLSPTTDTGTLGDQRTANPTPLITGATAPNALVQLFLDDQLVGQTTADADGFWQAVTTPLADGEQTLTVSAINHFGHRSTASTLTLTIQTQPPAPPSQLALLASDDTGRSPSDNLTQNDHPTVVGQAAANSLVTLFQGDDWLGETTADALGNWQIELTDTLLEGAAQLYAVTTDATGLDSAPSAPLTLTIDQTPPSTPTNLMLVGTSAPGVSTTAHLTNNVTPTIAGNGDPGTLVQLYSETKLLGTTVVDADGQWQITTPFLPDGTHTLVAVGYDAAENRSLNSTPLQVTIDATPPDLSLVSLFNNTDWAVGDRLSGWTKNAGDPVTAVAYQIYAADDTTTPLVSAVVPVAADGTFNAPLMLDGLTAGQPYVFTATATDAAGNVATRTFNFKAATATSPTDMGTTDNQPVGSYVERLQLILTAAVQNLTGNQQTALTQAMSTLLEIGKLIDAGSLPPTLAGAMQQLFALANQPLTQAQAQAVGQSYAATLMSGTEALVPQVMAAKLLATAYQVPALQAQLPTDGTATTLSTALQHLAQTYLATRSDPTQAVLSGGNTTNLLSQIGQASTQAAFTAAASRLGTTLTGVTAPAQAVQLVDRLLQSTQQLPTVQASLQDDAVAGGLVDMGLAYARLQPAPVDDPALLAQLPFQQLWQATDDASVQAAQPGIQAFFGGFTGTNAQRTLVNYQADLLNQLQTNGAFEPQTLPNPVAVQNAMAAGTWFIAPKPLSSSTAGGGSTSAIPPGDGSPATNSGGGGDLSAPLSWYAPPQTFSPSPMDAYFDPDGKPKAVGQPLQWKITLPVFNPFAPFQTDKVPNYTFSFYPQSYGGVSIRKIVGFPADVFVNRINAQGQLETSYAATVPSSANLYWKPAYGYGYIQLLNTELQPLPPTSAWAGIDPDQVVPPGDIPWGDTPPAWLPPGSTVGQLPSGGQFPEPPGTIEPYPSLSTDPSGATDPNHPDTPNYPQPDFPPECGLHPLPKPITQMDYLEVLMAVLSRVPCKAGNDLKTLVELVLHNETVQGFLAFLLGFTIACPEIALPALLLAANLSTLAGIADIAKGAFTTFRAKHENNETLVDVAAESFAQGLIALGPTLLTEGLLSLIGKLSCSTFKMGI